MRIQREYNEIIIMKDPFHSNRNYKILKIENSVHINLEKFEKFTISLWIRFDELHTGAIVSKIDESGVDAYKGWEVRLEKIDSQQFLIFNLIHAYPNDCIIVQAPNMDKLIDRNWHHLVLTYNGSGRAGGVRIFIDGNLENLITLKNCLLGNTSNNHSITVGSRINGANHFQGTVRDIRLLKNCIDQNNVLELMRESKMISKEIDYTKYEAESQEVLVRVKNLTRTFTIHHEPQIDVFSKLKSLVQHSGYERITVLDDLSFELKKGEMLGILGRNGSGKTTLLKIIGKIMRPTSGTVEVFGNISSFLSLGVGFNPDLTARQNVLLYGIILGESKKNMKEKIDNVIKFAELENFADVKVRDFSTGMTMRLAFSTALSVEPDILLVDEVISVGDYSFQQKSLEAFLKIKNSGKSIVFVSHNLDHLERFCDKLILLEKGKIIAHGNPDSVIDTYIKLMEK